MSGRGAGARRSPPTVVVVGLGPADESLTAPAALRAISAAPVTYLRTARHPAARALLHRGAIALDHHYENSSSFAQVYAGIVAELVEAAGRHGRIAYAVPGSPLVLESTVSALLADERVRVELVAGMSFLDLCWTALRIDPVEARVRLVDGEAFATAAARDEGPLLVTQLHRPGLLSAMKLAVEDEPSEPVVFLHHLGLSDEVVAAVPWAELDRSVAPDHLTSVFVPSLRAPVGFELAELQAVVERLRRECPWDRVQTHRSLVRHLLEEAYEVVEAIDELEAAGDDLSAGVHLEEELGDVLCQVLFHAVLGGEEGLFNLADVARTVRLKLVFRHPHVFEEGAELHDAAEVAARWEKAKRVEKGRESLMDGIPGVLPALLLATRLERTADGVGLGASRDPALTRAHLEGLLGAFLAGEDGPTGPLLFALARLAAERGLDPEDVLRREAQRFRAAFAAAEHVAARRGRALGDLGEDERAGLLLGADRPASSR